METPLNLAHRHQRKAEILLKAGKFDEAVLQHVAAEKALSEVVTTTNSAHILESLKLQRDYHIRQQAVVKRKKQLAEIVNKYEDEIKKMHSKAFDSISSTPEYDCQNTTILVEKVLKNVLQHDTLVNCITSAAELRKFKHEPLTRSVDSIIKSTMKFPKDDKLRLEELRISNEELKRILFILITDLEKANSENCVLKTLLESTLKNLKTPIHTCAFVSQGTYNSYPSTSVSKVENVDCPCDLSTLVSGNVQDSDFDKQSVDKMDKS